WPKALTAPPQGSSQALKFCLLTGFFDRVAERRADGQTLLLSSGAQAQLSHDSGVTQAHYLLALSTLGGGEGRNAIPIVQIALRLAPDDLLDALPENVSFKDEARYDKGRDRVDLRSLISYG